MVTESRVITLYKLKIIVSKFKLLKTTPYLEASALVDKRFKKLYLDKNSLRLIYFLAKHVTFAITKLFSLGSWCDDDSPALKFYNGPFDDSPLIAKYCASKIPPPVISDGSALHIEVLQDINFFATYSVLDSRKPNRFRFKLNFICVFFRMRRGLSLFRRLYSNSRLA